MTGIFGCDKLDRTYSYERTEQMGDYMNITKEEKKQEALRRLHTLSVKFDLGPNLEKYFSQDRLYYSYGYSMDTIHYDESYAESAKAFERAFQCLVYHAVEVETQFGKILSFLYVSDHREEWPIEELTGNRIMSYSYIIENGWDEGEFGDIRLDSPMGYLMRIG